jgi:hypothetical protein
MSPDARDSVRRTKTTKCKSELFNHFLKEATGQVMFPDARDTVRQAKTTRCKNELPNQPTGTDHPVQGMSRDARDAVRQGH